MDPRPTEPAVQPPGSQLLTDPKDGGVTLMVPPLGFWRAPKTPFLFTAFWLGMTLLFTAEFTGARMPRMDAGGWIGVGVFLGMFWLGGFWLLALVLQAATTQTVLTVRGAFLFLTCKGLFRTSRRRWLRTEVKEFVVEQSGLPARRGGPGYPQLRIRFKDWAWRVGVMAGRDRRELQWVADAMSQALAEATRRDPEPVPDVKEQPAESNAVLERTAHGLVLTVPPLGFRGAIPVVVIGGGIAGVILCLGAWGVASIGDYPWSWHTWLGVCVPVAIGLLAIAVALEAIGFAFRRDELEVGAGVFTMRNTTWRGGVRTREWGQSQIARIDVDVGSNPLPRLRLHFTNGKRKGLLIYHSEDELLWIATLLREGLHKPGSRPG